MAKCRLSADDVEWVVNDIAELGVKIGDQFFFLYKGTSLVYDDEPYEEGETSYPAGTKMRWRHVYKREFGECCNPVNYKDPGRIGTVDINDGGDWRPLPAAGKTDG